MHIRQWVATEALTHLIALADLEASRNNSLFRPEWRPTPRPCIPDDEMPREYPYFHAARGDV